MMGLREVHHKQLLDELNKGQEEQTYMGSPPNAVSTLALHILRSPVFCILNHYLSLQISFWRS